MDLQKQIINYIGLTLFDRALLSCGALSSQEALFAMSKKHNVTALVSEGMKRSKDYKTLIPEFDQLSEKYLFQYAHQSVELERVTKVLEQNGYPYVLLKGAVIRKLYPEPHLRTSCDIDILTEEPDETIHSIMSSLGYQFAVDAGTTINFVKPPAVEFEMHRCLFDDKMDFSGYFNDIWNRTVPSNDGRAERFLTQDDFYVYMIAHIAKHIDRYGCGIRPFIDVYLYHQKMPNVDLSGARKILEGIGLLDFEKRICSLTKAWFETGVLSKEDEMLTKFLFGVGLYGNTRINAAQTVRKSGSSKRGRLSLLIRHVFPPMRIMRPMYPRLLKCGLFLPLTWALRWFRLLFHGRKKTTKVIRGINRINDDHVRDLSQIMHEFGLKEENR